MFSIFFGFFSFLSLDTSIARADSFSTIESLKGLVAVQRDGEFLVVYNGFKVEEDDKVFTSGEAALNYLKKFGWQEISEGENLIGLKNGKGIEKPTYSFETHTRNPSFEYISPKKLIL